MKRLLYLAMITAFAACAGNATKNQNEEEQSQETVAEEAPFVSEPDGYINGHGYVDLGLSVVWATNNIGATTPEEYGDYYAWGETATKNTYTRDNCTSKRINAESIAGTSNDAATVNWGNEWRMPTSAEFEELFTHCTFELSSYNDVSGCKITGKNGKSIFLPAAGNKYHVAGDYDNGVRGVCQYWTASTAGSLKMPVYITAGLDYSVNQGLRYIGLSVRPIAVQE